MNGEEEVGDKGTEGGKMKNTPTNKRPWKMVQKTRHPCRMKCEYEGKLIKNDVKMRHEKKGH